MGAHVTPVRLVDRRHGFGKPIAGETPVHLGAGELLEREIVIAARLPRTVDGPAVRRSDVETAGHLQDRLARDRLELPPITVRGGQQRDVLRSFGVREADHAGPSRTLAGCRTAPSPAPCSRSGRGDRPWRCPSPQRQSRLRRTSRKSPPSPSREVACRLRPCRADLRDPLILSYSLIDDTVRSEALLSHRPSNEGGLNLPCLVE